MSKRSIDIKPADTRPYIDILFGEVIEDMLNKGHIVMNEYYLKIIVDKLNEYKKTRSLSLACDICQMMLGEKSVYDEDI